MKQITQYLLLFILLIGTVSAMDFDPDKCEYFEYGVEDYEVGYQCFQYECSQGAIDDFGKYFYSKYMSWEDYPNNERYFGGWTERIFFDGDCPPEDERNHEPTVPLHPTDVPEFTFIGMGAIIAIIGLLVIGKRRK